MKFNITARHLNLTPALRKYAEKRIMQVKKYAGKITSAHIILNVEKDRHIAEIILGLSRNNITAKATAGDMYGAIDLVADKVKNQLRKHMDRVKTHKDIPPYSVAADMNRAGEQGFGEKAGIEPQLEDIREFKITRQTVSDALKILDEKELNFWVFRNSEDDSINVVYKNGPNNRGMLIVK